MGLVALFYVLFIGQDIIIPLIFATLIAILLNPLVNFLCRYKCSRPLAIAVVLVLAFLILIGLLYFLGSRFAVFSESFPAIKTKILDLADQALDWASATFNVPQTQIQAWLDKTKNEGMDNGSAIIGQTLVNMTDVLVLIFLLPVYIFMILFYKPLLLSFIAQLFHHERHSVVAEVLTETKTLIQSYLIGLLLEMAIVATLNSIGLLIIGVKYAIMLGIIGAVLNVIPYIGGIIALALTMLVALVTKSPISMLYVAIVYVTVQFLDNNLIVPRIVASRVKINALVSIIVVLIGGALWGVPGMFLSIPLTAILKVIFDRIEPLQPWGFVLGDDMPAFTNFLNLPKRKKAVKLKAVKK